MEQQSCDQTQEIRVRRPFVDLVKDLAVEATVPTKRGETWPGEEVPTGFEALKKNSVFSKTGLMVHLPRSFKLNKQVRDS